jgi:glycosyltransferase involved in cell wall biosynthesis
MFGGHQSFLPALFGKVFGKPCLIICGGTDCVAFPSINYGNFKGGILATVTRWSYKLAAHILPVHKSLIEYVYTYSDADFKKQGIKFFIPRLKTPMTVINYGFDPDKWVESKQKIENSFITVAAGLDKPYRAKLKGVDLILEAALSFPNAIFTIIGCPENYKLPVKSQNVKTYSYVSNAELKDIYNKHEFYLQVSMSEGFPNAICEAMTCGCIPIGSNVGGIPDIVGDSGFILMKRDIEQFKNILADAMNSDKKALSQKARTRIMEMYPKDLRKEQLLDLIAKLIS